jgi:flagellar biosynthesis protein FlhA
LGATLLRLGLNVASTRIVLINGHTGAHAAGHVIAAFGQFVVGGNYAVGMVVFTVLVIINFVVITKGAGRISEVSARFTLDAMPGRQMAIDADLNAGIITQAEAIVRRQEVREEADFYGAMDGASKFVRGDAIAGILIVFINLFGGTIIGAAQHGMSLADAGRTYALLTIGDGLVAQIPALLLSVAVAILVTRVSRPHDMSQQIMSQVLGQPRRWASPAASGAARHHSRHAESGVLGMAAGLRRRRVLSEQARAREKKAAATKPAGTGTPPNSGSCPGTTSSRSI